MRYTIRIVFNGLPVKKWDEPVKTMQQAKKFANEVVDSTVKSCEIMDNITNKTLKIK